MLIHITYFVGQLEGGTNGRQVTHLESICRGERWSKEF